MMLYIEIFYWVNIRGSNDKEGGMYPVNTYTCLSTIVMEAFFVRNVLFPNWHNHSFYLVYDQHKKIA